MPLQFSGYQTRTARFQDELEAPLNDVLGATAEQTFSELPINSMLRIQELASARSTGPRLTPEVAQQRIKDAGLEGHLSAPWVSTDAALDILIERKNNELRRQDLLSRAPSGVGSSAAQLGTAFAASMLDPVNVGLAFVPVVGEARYLRYLAKAKGIIGRTGVRAGVGAIEGAVGAAIVEPLTFIAKTQEQADYDFQDSLLNVAFGTAFGGGLHSIAGAGADAAKAVGKRFSVADVASVPKAAEAPPMGSAAARVADEPMPTRESAMRAAVAQAMEGKAVNVEPILPKRQIDSPEFRQWFGESKVVDESGQPLRVYHGTAMDFDSFDIGMSGVNFEQGDGFAFFTNKADEGYPDSASDYARNAAGKHPGAVVVPAFVKLEKPLIVNADGHYNAVTAFDKQAKQIAQQVKDGGHDGVIVQYSDGSGDRLIAATRPEQIKSAIGNSGRFDPNSASLTDAAKLQASPEADVTADVRASTAADQQLKDTPRASDEIAEQQALLADEEAQLKEAAKLAGIDLTDELADVEETLALAETYGKAARAAVLCGVNH